MRIFNLKNLFFALFLTTLAAGAQAQCKPDKANTPFPSLTVKQMDGTDLSTFQLPANQNIIVIYFDPFCDHCEQQAKWIRERIDAFKGVTLLWISWGEMEDIKGFVEKHFGGVKKADMYFTKDMNYAMDQWFGYSETPSIYIYSKQRYRTMCFTKETPVDELLKYVK